MGVSMVEQAGTCMRVSHLILRPEKIVKPIARAGKLVNVFHKRPVAPVIQGKNYSGNTRNGLHVKSLKEAWVAMPTRWIVKNGAMIMTFVTSARTNITAGKAIHAFRLSRTIAPERTGLHVGSVRRSGISVLMACKEN